MSTSVSVSLQGSELEANGHAPTPWISANFSQAWYKDTLTEAQGLDANQSTRREIVFAASFLESYIFEWVRGIKIDGTLKYFPTEGKLRSLKSKWTSIPAKLHHDGLISKVPNLDLAPLDKLVKYRNGLVHARASRPSTPELAADAQPVPGVDELAKIPHGWALDVAKNLVLQLHTELGTPPPDYVK
jgi:hypothetical protein